MYQNCPYEILSSFCREISKHVLFLIILMPSQLISYKCFLHTIYELFRLHKLMYIKIIPEVHTISGPYYIFQEEVPTSSKSQSWTSQILSQNFMLTAFVCWSQNFERETMGFCFSWREVQTEFAIPKGQFKLFTLARK